MKSNRFSEAYARAILTNRWKVLLLCLLAVAAMGYGATRLKFSDDNQAFFGNHIPEVRTLRDFEKSFIPTQSVLIQVAPKTGTVFDPATLSLIQKITEESWHIPFVLSVQSLTNYSHTRADGDDIIVEPLVDPEKPIDAASAERAERIAEDSPELVHRLVSESGNAAGIFVSVVPPKDSTGAPAEVVRYVREMRDKVLASNPNVEINLSGSVFSNITFADAAERDLIYLVPLALVLSLLLLLFGLGTFSGFAASLMTMAGATAVALGFAGWAGIQLSPGTAVSPLAVMVLVVASCVHSVMLWKEGKREGLESDAALARSIASTLVPVTVANVTTAIGFLCLLFSSSPPLQEMGLLIAVGVVFGWILSLALLPVGCSLLPDADLPWLNIPESWLEALARFTIRRRRAILFVFAIFALGAIYGISRIGFEDDFVKYFDESFEFRRDADAIEKKLTGLNVVQFAFDSGKPRGVFDPDFLKKVDRFVEWAETQGKVAYVASPTRLFKRLNMSMNGDDKAMYKIADGEEKNAQFLMFYELSLPVGQDLNSSMDVDRAKALVAVVLKGATSSDLRALAANAEQWLKGNEPSIFTKATGFSLVFANITKRNNESMLYGVVLALMMVSASMMFALRDWRMGLISLVPNLAPALLAFGAWGLTFQNVNLGSSIVTTMTFGIVVDDTIHYLVGYVRARRHLGLAPREAIIATTKHLGNAIILTTIAITVGFLVMAMSGFQINEHVGWLTAIVVVVALLCDLLMLPPLVLVLERRIG